MSRSRVSSLEDWHATNGSATYPFPGDVLTELGAAALAVAGAAPTPLSLGDATERHVPEWTVSGNTARLVPGHEVEGCAVVR